MIIEVVVVLVVAVVVVVPTIRYIDFGIFCARGTWCVCVTFDRQQQKEFCYPVTYIHLVFGTIRK